MRILALMMLLTGMTFASTQTKAQTYDPAYPVCMHLVTIGGGGYEDCSYYTLDQCRISASGRAGSCSLNPYYAGGSQGGQYQRSRRGYR